MYCSKCGRELPPSGICPCQQQNQNPGQDYHQNPNQGYQQYPNQGYQQNPGQGYQHNNWECGTGRFQTVLYSLSRFHGGALSLVFIILYTLSLALTLYSGFRGGAAGMAGSLIGSLPAILICIGLWMLFAKSKGTPTTAGYSLAAAGLVIKIIYTLLVDVILIVVFLLGGAMLREFVYEDSFMTIGIVGALVVVIVAVISVIYLVKLRKVASSSREMLRGTRLSPQVSLFPVVILSISALFSVIRLLVSVPLTQYVYRLLDQFAMVLYFEMGSEGVDSLYQLAGTLLGGSVFATISSLVSLAVTLLAIVLLVQYRSVTREARW